MSDAEHPCLPTPEDRAAAFLAPAFELPSDGNPELASLLASARADAADHAMGAAAAISLAVEAVVVTNPNSAGLGIVDCDALNWLSTQLTSAAENLLALIEERPTRWRTCRDADSSISRALAELRRLADEGRRA